MNVFQLNYEARLKSWYDLRKSLENSDIKTRCTQIDDWWQKAPIVNHYLHPQEVTDWPGPWDLLNDNTYCHIARGLGMVYTLLLLGIKDVDFSIAKDDNSEDCAIVLVTNTYILNYYPNTVLLNNSTDFTLTQSINIHLLKNKI